MITVEYSILQYKPTITEDELIYVGLATHLYDEGYNIDYRNVHIIEDKKRLYSFNDELDKSLINIILTSIKNEWEYYDLLSSERNYSSLNEFTRRYVANFNFSSIENMYFETVEEADKFIDETVRYILNYSLDKKKRMSEKEKEDYLDKVLSVHYEEVKKNKQIEAKKTEEKITFDFVISDNISNENVYIKKLNVNTQTINTVRSYTAFSIVNKVKIIFSFTNGYGNFPDSAKRYIKEAECIIVPEEHLLEEVSKLLDENKHENVLV